MFVNAIMYYKVKDPISAVTNVDDYSGSARLLAATTLRNVLGTRNLGDILSERESIAQEMQVAWLCTVVCASVSVYLVLISAAGASLPPPSAAGLAAPTIKTKLLLFATMSRTDRSLQSAPCGTVSSLTINIF